MVVVQQTEGKSIAAHREIAAGQNVLKPNGLHLFPRG
jgi:hypothetical protein